MVFWYRWKNIHGAYGLWHLCRGGGKALCGINMHILGRDGQMREQGSVPVCFRCERCMRSQKPEIKKRDKVNEEHVSEG